MPVGWTHISFYNMWERWTLLQTQFSQGKKGYFFFRPLTRFENRSLHFYQLFHQPSPTQLKVLNVPWRNAFWEGHDIFSNFAPSLVFPHQQKQLLVSDVTKLAVAQNDLSNWSWTAVGFRTCTTCTMTTWTVQTTSSAPVMYHFVRMFRPGITDTAYTQVHGPQHKPGVFNTTTMFTKFRKYRPQRDVRHILQRCIGAYTCVQSFWEVQLQVQQSKPQIYPFQIKLDMRKR